MPVTSLSESEFDAAVAGGVCVVDFWATWCGPCRMMAPIFESVAAEMAGRPVKFFRVDVDEAPMSAGRFGVQSIPTLLVLKDGVESDVSVGVTPPAKLRKMIEAALS